MIRTGVGHVALPRIDRSEFIQCASRPARRFIASGTTGWRSACRRISAMSESAIATPGMAALVSASRDGAFLTGILECFRVQPVRGSSSRRGAQALAGADHLGGARLRPGHHPGRSARAALCRAGRRDVAGAIDRVAHRAVVVSFELENPLEKLGSVSNSAAFFPLRNDLRKSPSVCRARRRRPNVKNSAGSLKPNCAPSRGIEK